MRGENGGAWITFRVLQRAQISSAVRQDRGPEFPLRARLCAHSPLWTERSRQNLWGSQNRLWATSNEIFRGPQIVLKKKLRKTFKPLGRWISIPLNLLKKCLQKWYLLGERP